uniref:uncharacterized protein LOC114585000 isoform X1 n=1 Tax=Podarcis muralis TaxID=64176 RepID=UPI0010A002B4|nr:uncharacterized protein LOC114585000 isoform X1 [Podarcis muralis]XP_028563109.1 uncharacterized protein LOC114585000 isoform X1 [Podarcis muralis]XP_028563110.1 uncharacterized protein LOC114585000 isoform X1 [Podarcis muralis]XP_028563111.1 uncharacterized protein LOC114585000 isoform X1 [Podarcis muralis]XP_028563112.1 uncharacterized protein LOC114585000 isoform X1 [Podarcis muralis]
MESTKEEGSVIWIDEDEAESSLGSCILLADDAEEIPLKRENTEEAVDEEVIVTFCKRAKVMPHARYDCPTHPFEQGECETSCPLGRNAETCSECYCYICDKVAAECKDWVTPSFCHCNAHNKSKFWKDQWNSALTGSLSQFNLELSEIDADVQHGGVLLQKFVHDVSVEYNKYLSGNRIAPDFPKCLCHRNLRPGQCEKCSSYPLYTVHSYASVSELVTAFLNLAEKERPKTEVIMLMGATREIALHKDLTPFSRNVGHLVSLSQAVPCLMSRITRRLQRLLVLNDFPKPLYNKLTGFYHSIPFPVHCHIFSNSLNFAPWDHCLLISVLKGQNVTGQRMLKGKKECLCETVAVVEARIERMEGCRQYKELIRYLKVVKCNDSKWLQKWQDKVPFYLCKSGDFAGAAQALFIVYPRSCCAACRLSLLQFEVYLKMFRSGQAPFGNDMEGSVLWGPVGTPVKLPVLLKQMFKLFYCNISLYTSPKCWSSMIKIFASHPVVGADGSLTAITLKEPSQEFQQVVSEESCYIVEQLTKNPHSNVTFSKHFGQDSPLEAGLIFVVQAVRHMILMEHNSLCSFLEIVLAFGNNLWALKLLLESLAYHEKAVRNIVSLLLADLCCNKTQMLGLWQHWGAQYVGELMCLFLTSRDRNLPSVGISIINIIVENLPMCPWAKQVSKFLQKSTKPFGWADYEVSTFIAISQSSLRLRLPRVSQLPSPLATSEQQSSG